MAEETQETETMAKIKESKEASYELHSAVGSEFIAYGCRGTVSAKMPRNKQSVKKTAKIKKDRQCTLKRLHKTAFALEKQQVLYISVCARARECVRACTGAGVCFARL